MIRLQVQPLWRSMRGWCGADGVVGLGACLVWCGGGGVCVGGQTRLQSVARAGEQTYDGIADCAIKIIKNVRTLAT